MRHQPGARVRVKRYMCLRDTQINKGRRGVIVAYSLWPSSWRVILDGFSAEEFSISEDDLELLSPLECLSEATE